jgi:starch synthase
MATQLLTIISVSAEVSPFSKTGGLGDVANALPKALSKLGHKVIMITPFYGFIRDQGLKIEELGKDKIKIGDQTYPVVFRKTDLNFEIPVYFIYNRDLFSRSKIYAYPDNNLRFLFFDLAVIKLIKKFNLKANVIHCHDWHTGLIPNYIKLEYKNDPTFKKTSCVFTIHNLPFQFGHDWWKIPPKHQDSGKGLPPTTPKKIEHINFTKRAILNADIINTVSERYANEILTPEFGQGLEKILNKRKKDLYGIVNGIDYTVFNPAFDQNVYYNYDWNSLDRKKKNKLCLQKELRMEQNADIPVIGLVHRLTEQKGFDLIMQIMPLLTKTPLQIVIVGSGGKDYLKYFKKAAKEYPRQVAIHSPFTEKMASKVYAGSDMFLMPSRYEPCGISQLISLRYGSIPIVRETGGLSDTISNFNPKTGRGNGFVFSAYTKEHLLIAITRALENYKYPKVWEHLTWQAMRMSYSWEIPAKKYVRLYQLAMKK